MSVDEHRANCPLVSYLLLAYNNADFIQEALASAFAQTYEPLEIVIADDHSTDGTERYIQEAAAAYKGPHAVRLLRNVNNLGIGGNISGAMRECHGDLVVVAAGDDRSFPQRTSVLVDAWLRSGRQATSIFSSYILMSDEGHVIGKGGRRDCVNGITQLHGDLSTFVKTRSPVVNGCTHAWSPRLFDYFGPITSDLEDLVLSFRTLAIGQMWYVDEPLVQYRRHYHNASFLAEADDTRSFEHREERLLSVDKKSIAALDNLSLDTELLRSHRQVPDSVANSLQRVLARTRARYELEHRMLTGTFGQRAEVWLAFALGPHLVTALKASPRLLPRPLYRRLYEWRQRRRRRTGMVDAQVS